MPTIAELLVRMCANPRHVRFSDALRVCKACFGEPRVHGSHHVFRTPWRGDPRVNIQNRGGFVPPYQVRQVIAAVRRWEEEHGQGR